MMREPALEVTPPPAGNQQVASTTPGKIMKVVLHLNSGDKERMGEVLDEAQNLLDFYRQTNQIARVEIITNGGGINLLRSATSPYPERIKELYSKYNNLVFVACQNAIDRIKSEQGDIAELLPEAVVIDSAVAQIMRRQQQGWAYIQV
jgi:intracellular sulfur oxidation DsrE/DsrF family protein